jgi:protein-S-isoprenylcysteine O-methyltransferase Ste14
LNERAKLNPRSIWTKLLEKLVQYIVARSYLDYKSYEILSAVVFGSFLELGVVPYILISLGRWLDNLFGIEPLLPKEDAVVLGLLAFVIGIPWLSWSIYLQHTRGRGTPLPLLPTKTLLNEGPYKYTRNPMSFGAIFWLAGWALIFDSPVALFGGVGAFSVMVLTYIRMVEEKELRQRFGEPYMNYQASTPFLIPNLFGKTREKF